MNRKEKYRNSEKGKLSKKKWNNWELNKKYYKEDICISCQQLKTIVSKGNCDSCRKKIKKLSGNA